MLRLVHARQVPCWPWHLRDLTDEPFFEATCRTCERDVAQPVAARGEVPICLYCGIASGLVDPTDGPLGEPLQRSNSD